MPLETLLTFFTFFLSTIGFLSLSLLPQGNPFLIFLLISLSFLALFRYLRSKTLPEPFTSSCLQVMLVLLLVELFVRGLMMTLFYLVVILQLYRLFTLKRAADFIHVHLIAFLQLLFTAGQSFGVEFSFIFVLFCFVATLTAILYHFQTESAKHHFQGDQAVSLLFLVGVFSLSSVLFASTLLLFFLFPRFGAFYLEVGANRIQKRIHQTEVMTGFTHQVVLGSMAKIKQSQDRVARVQFAGRKKPFSFPIYLRGTVLSSFDHNRWQPDPFAAHQRINFAYPEKISFPFRITGQTVKTRAQLLVDLKEIDTLFLPAFTQTFQGRVAALKLYADGTMKKAGWTQQASLFYETESSLGPPGAVAIQDSNLPLPGSLERSRTLELPLTLQAPLRALAERVTLRAHTPYQKAFQMSRYLRQNYRYSTSLQASSRPILDFLQHRFPADCEYFASALALMLRSLQIPSRLVVGFAGGEWNKVGKFYLFRQKDAHTWVEAYLPGKGWVLFDPTPPAITGRTLPLSKKLSQILATFEMRWNKYIITYDRATQQAQFAKLKKVLTEKASFLILGLSLFFFFLVVKKRNLSFSLSWLAFPTTDPFLRTFFSLERSLCANVCLTPLEKKTSLPSSLQEDYLEHAYLYYNTRFGNRQWTKEELKKLRDFCKKVRQYKKD